ncbi:GtrA family protein [uncultured Tessaracoccus sp.]|uniref:GtrA family protein n=1 Tax=uncultured Tessaracoccus sp. TaxID=905023 RepID=UPI0025F807E0|nr:GtrA family protein [uncultured Tessaracoccus sp.]
MRALWQRHGASFVQFLKFGFVGGSGVLVNLLVNIVMNKLHGGTVNAHQVLWAIPGTAYNVRFTHLAWLVPFLVANVWNFQLNRWWTFRSSKLAGWWREFWPFFAVGSVAMLVGLGLKVLMTNPTSPFYLPEPWFHEQRGLQSREYWSQLIAIFLTLPINFIVNKLWTFKAVRAPRTVDEVVGELQEEH